MADNDITVKINRRDGAVEITGSDKDWIAEQLEKLAVVYRDEPEGERPAKDPPPRRSDDQGANGATEKKTRTRRSGRSSSRATRVPELEQQLTRPVQAKLQQWRDEREAKFKTLSDQAAIIATFLLDELQVDAVNPDQIYTVYAVMGWSPPGNPKGQLENARARDGYFGGWKDGKLQLSHKGERFGRIEAKEPPKKKGE